MSGLALWFLVIALLSAATAFGGTAGVAPLAAKIVFFAAMGLFAVVMAIWAIVTLVSGRRPPVGWGRE